MQNSKINHKNGYVEKLTDNLAEGIDPKIFLDDLNKGKGNELKRKFKAIYSSSALAVNNFAIVKTYRQNFSIFGYTKFDQAGFEQEFTTGLNGTPPTLDFFLENNDVLIAFESKYLEPLDITRACFKPKYKTLKYLSRFWTDMIDEYQGKDLNLDVAQLMKHSFGLINNQRDKNQKKILVYIYWLPINYREIDNYRKHEAELIDFENRMKVQNDIRFHSMSYPEFWKEYENDFFIGDNVKKVKERYLYSF